MSITLRPDINSSINKNLKCDDCLVYIVFRIDVKKLAFFKAYGDFYEIELNIKF